MIAKIRMKRAESEDRTRRGEFEGERIELVFGEIVPMSPQSDRHYALVLHLNMLEPDLAILAGSTWDHSTIAESPLVVIEVSVDSFRFDRTTKQRLYALAGIPEYWIINAIEDQIEVHR